MTQEEKQIKLAEAAGWKHIQQLHSGWHGWREQGPLEELPDYFNDLNAVHELENKLSDNQTSEYTALLMRNKSSRGNRGAVFWSLTHATAAQRCEAIGKTLNLW